MCLDAVKPRSLIFAQLSEQVIVFSRSPGRLWQEGCFAGQVDRLFADSFFDAADQVLNLAGLLLRIA